MKKFDLKENKKRGSSQIGSSNKLPPVNSKQNMPNNFSLQTSNHQDDGLIGILHEYFMKNNFMETLEVFQKDCVKGFRQSTKTQEELKKQLMTYYEQGNRDQFFNRFTQYVPLSMRTKDIQTMKMEFYIQLYFFVYSVHPLLGKKKIIDTTAKQSFIAYLEGRGAILSKSNDFLQYFALAYLPKPQQHPTFKVIFTKQWHVELKKKVAYFIQKLYPTGKIPTLVTIYDKFIEIQLEKMSNATHTQQDEQFEIQEHIAEDEENMMNNPQPVLHEKNNGAQKDSNPTHIGVNSIKHQLEAEEIENLKQKIQEHEEERKQLLNYIEAIKNKYQILQNNFQEFSDAAQNTLMESQSKWFKITQQIYTITDDLLNVCRKQQEGVPLQDPQIVEKISQKLGKYDKFIRMNVEDLFSDNVDFSLFERPDNDASVDLTRNARNHKLIQLDFNKISVCLRQAQNESAPPQDLKAQYQSKYLLLQALRWRITKTRGVFAKREVVLSFTLFDIFGLKKKDKLLENLLHSKNSQIVFETVLLINALSKDYYGRDYLTNEYLIKICVEALKNPLFEERSKDQIFMAFQWLSIRRPVQIIMVQNDLIKILVSKLDKERQTMQQYMMEYISALLLNILLNKEGYRKSEEIKSEILMTLINLMEHEEMNIRSFVHGSLFPLLAKKVFREKAKQFGMEEIIKYLLEQTPSTELEHQLKYLQTRLEMEEDTIEDEEDNQDDSNDQDELNDEEYGEDSELIEIISTSINGQQLLMKKYLLTGPDSISQMNTIKEEVEITLKRKSVQFDNSFYERQSVNTPLLGKIKRNISNNNSVYSNKSSHRVLKSEMNSRSQINNKPNGRLDTVHQNNSEVSVKQFGEEKKQIQLIKEEEKSVEGTFRVHQKQKQNESDLLEGHNPSNLPQQPVDQSANFTKKSQPPQPEIKEYEKTVEYKSAFQTRARIVRTPPEKK